MFSLSIWVFAASVLVQTYGFRVTTKWNDRIVGGEAVNINDHLYQLSLQAYAQHYCGASLLKAAVALSAAHCNKFAAEYFTIRSGSSLSNSGGTVVAVNQIINHPNFNAVTLDYDAAIVQLNQELVYGQTITIQPKNQNVPVGAVAFVTGWGRIYSGGPFSKQLLKVNLAQLSDTECNQRNSPGAITNSMTCYASPGKDTCNGDSGGPLVYNFRQVGIVSWGPPLCADPVRPGVFTKISNAVVHDFITQYAG